VTVHDSQSEFDDWMKRATDAQNISQLAAAGGVPGEVNPR
jgi:cytochrome c oxidase subunit II